MENTICAINIETFTESPQLPNKLAFAMAFAFAWRCFELNAPIASLCNQIIKTSYSTPYNVPCENRKGLLRLRYQLFDFVLFLLSILSPLFQRSKMCAQINITSVHNKAQHSASFHFDRFGIEHSTVQWAASKMTRILYKSFQARNLYVWKFLLQITSKPVDNGWKTHTQNA